MQHELLSRRRAGLAALRRRFVRAKVEGDLPHDSDPAALARYIITVAQGMSVQAVERRHRAELQRVMRTAMRAWPG